MSNHTPGPWRIEQGALLTIEADSHLGPLAELRSRLDYGGMHSAVAATREANARLIAAAPDLLAALQALKAAGGIWPDLLGKVDAAIAKATGND